MAWQWRAKKEIAQGWKWMRQQNPDAAAEAERWAEENKEDMKDVDSMDNAALAGVVVGLAVPFVG